MNQRHIDFKHTVKTQNDLLEELEESFRQGTKDIQSYIDSRIGLDVNESITVEDLLELNHDGKDRNIKYTAVIVSGATSYVGLSRIVGLSAPRIRQIVYNTLKKINPELNKMLLPELKRKRIVLLKKLLSM